MTGISSSVHLLVESDGCGGKADEAAFPFIRHVFILFRIGLIVSIMATLKINASSPPLSLSLTITLLKEKIRG